MKTTIELPAALYQSAKELAVSRNLPLGELIVWLLARTFTEGNQPESSGDDDFSEWRGELL